MVGSHGGKMHISTPDASDSGLSCVVGAAMSRDTMVARAAPSPIAAIV